MLPGCKSFSPRMKPLAHETATVGPRTVPPAWPKPLRRGEGPVRSSIAGGKAQECSRPPRPARGRSASAAPSHGPVARNPPTNSWLCNIAAVGDRPRSVPSDVLRSGTDRARVGVSRGAPDALTRQVCVAIFRRSLPRYRRTRPAASRLASGRRAGCGRTHRRSSDGCGSCILEGLE